MIVRTSMVLVVTGTLFTLIGAFAPVANLGAAATPTSLYQIIGGLLGWQVGAPALPAGLTAIELRLLGGAGVLAVAAFLAIVLAVSKFLRSSLVPCVLMTFAAGFLMFTISGIRDVAVVVPDSYGWILLIAGSLMATVTGVFTLFGPGQDERLKTMTEAPKKKKGRLPFEVETTAKPDPVPPPPPAKAEPPKAKPAKPAEPVRADKHTANELPPSPPPPGKPKIPPPQRDTPKPQRLSEAPKAETPKPAAAPKDSKPVASKPADAAEPAPPKLQAPKPEAPKPQAPKPHAPESQAPKSQTPESAGGDAPKAGVRDLTPDTLAPMPTSGYSGEEPTESGGWVLSGFDANGMAVRLNISDVDLRAAEDGIVIGRSAKHARLVLNDDSVSRRHARLSGRSPLTIEDLDSANGTVVNREMLTPGEKVPIEPGVAIEIGAVRLTLVRS